MYITLLITEEEYAQKLAEASGKPEELQIMNDFAWSIRRSYPLRSLEIGKTVCDLALEWQDDVALAYGYENTGAAYYLLSMYQDSLTDLMHARSMFSELKLEEAEATVIRTIGNIYHSINENDKAIEEYNIALEISKRLNDPVSVAYNMGNIGYVLKKKGELKESKQYMVRAINAMLKEDDDIGLSDAFNILGAVHLEEGAVESAYKEFMKAYYIASKVNHVRGMATSKMYMGSYYSAKDQKDEAIDEYQKALDYASSMGEKLLIGEIHMHLSEVYEKFNQPVKALSFFKEYERIKTQIFEGVKQHEISATISNEKLKQSQKEKEEILRRSDELKRAYQEIEDKNHELEKLSIVANKINEAVVIADKNGEIEFFNDSFIRSSGHTPEEFYVEYAGRLNLQSFAEEEKINAIIEKFKTVDAPVHYDSYHTTKSGSIKWTSASFSPVYKEGGLNKIVVVYSDITDRKEFSDRLKKSNKNIIDSLNYAKTIQEAVLPNKMRFVEAFEDHFILYQPKDIVSGDFYWLDKRGPYTIFAVVDCTGHGVPGGFMSMMGNDYLTQIVTDNQISSPADALKVLNKRIQIALKQTGDGDSKDGMDMAICAVNMETLDLEYAGANNPLYIVRDKSLIVLEATRESIGGGSRTINKEFNLERFKLEKGDQLYLFTDGYIDQFGGPKSSTGGKKFGYRRFKELIVEISDLPMKGQKTLLSEHYKQWRSNIEQLDDICILGAKF